MSGPRRRRRSRCRGARPRRPALARGGALAVTALAAAASACGGERTFDVHEFVEEANAAGAGIELGEPLTSSGPDRQIHDVELAASATQTHGGGSLTVTPSVEAGEAEYRRCEDAATLACFRASNVVLIVDGEELDPEQLTRLEDAFRELGGD